MNTEPPWLSNSKNKTYPALDRDLNVDVLIIGGGITGITAAYLLIKAGKSVALVERDTIGSGETGHTTAHITYPTDVRLTKLVDCFGPAHAQAAWEAQQAASEKMVEIVAAEALEAELQHIPGYLFASLTADIEKEAPELLTESQLAADMGFDTAYVNSAPGVNRPAIRFANQLKFHPGKYLHQLTERLADAGGQIFENSEVTSLEDDPLCAQCNGHRIHCHDVFIATHVPLQGISSTLSAALFQTKLAGYSTYALGARLPAGTLPEALLWDTSDPYVYLRYDRHDDCDYVIIGGEDHKTGQVDDTEACYCRLQTTLLQLFPNAEVDRRWSGQVIETNDGLPFIGEAALGQFIATGYAGTGMTWGTLAAMMFHDYVIGIDNPWTDLLSVTRKPLSKTWDYLVENKDYPYYLVKGLFTSSDAAPVHLLCGEGKIIKHEGHKVAASRTEDGQLCLLSAICPHLGCVVAWNDAEKTWDCPCHGSRFTTEGQVLAGPAETPLQPCA